MLVSLPCVHRKRPTLDAGFRDGLTKGEVRLTGMRAEFYEHGGPHRRNEVTCKGDVPGPVPDAIRTESIRRECERWKTGGKSVGTQFRVESSMRFFALARYDKAHKAIRSDITIG